MIVSPMIVIPLPRNSKFRSVCTPAINYMTYPIAEKQKLKEAVQIRDGKKLRQMQREVNSM